MRKLLFLLAAMYCFVINLWAGNTITYTANEKLPETTEMFSSGIYTEAFSVAISSHEFSNGTGTITFDGDVTEIGDFAFSLCDMLTSITIPNSVTTIGGSTFMGCSALTSITIPNSVTTIGESAFYDCSSLTSITIPNSVTTIGERVFYGCSSLTSVTIPNSVTTIGDDAFYICSSLTSVTIPNSVTAIGERVFYGCSSLTSVTIGNSVTTIGYGAFQNCSSLTSVIIPNSVTTIGERVFYGCSSLTSVTIGNSVTTIGMQAFYDCSSLTSVIIPNSVTTIGERVFEGCSSLTSVTIPNSVTTIGDEAFYNCSSLTSVTIPNSIETIKFGTFNGCSSLITITIPASVTAIEGSAFANCTGLTSITCLAVNPPACDYACFYNVKSSIPIYVPKASISDYKTADEWKDFTNYMAYTPEKYGLCVKGEQVTSDHCSDILGDGTVSYDPATQTLTLDNANITYDGTGVIDIYQDITINCIGENTVYCTNTTNGDAISNGVGKTTITGSGTLSVKSDAMSAIYGEYDLTISDGCKVTAQSAKGSAVSLASEPLTIDNATLIAKGNGTNPTIIECDELIMLNGVAIRTAHTYDATTHKFLTAGGEEAKDDIIIGVEGTGLEELTVDNAQGTVKKMIIDNQLLIRHNGKLYNALGGRMK